MSKHTPGPWVVGPVDDTVVTHLGADGVRYEVAQIDGDYNEPGLWPVMEANARLIAAAPDLLDEARKQVTWLRHLRTEAVGSLRGSLIDGIDQSIKYLSAAIAKAEGRS